MCVCVRERVRLAAGPSLFSFPFLFFFGFFFLFSFFFFLRATSTRGAVPPSFSPSTGG